MCKHEAEHRCYCKEHHCRYRSLKEAILNDVKIEFNYNINENLIGRDYLVHTQKSNNLLKHIKGREIYHKWQYTNANCYEILYRGQLLEVEFINRHWYWLDWNKQRGKHGGYTINPAYDFIITLKEYRLGTKEDHY
jgi:hypothetical protein